MQINEIEAIVSNSKWEQVADILVNYSTKVGKGEKVLITMVEIDTFPLARAVHSAAVRAGGLPHIEFQSAYLEKDLMSYGTEEQVKWIPELNAYGMEWADVYIGLRGNRNPYEFSDIEEEKIKLHKQAMGHVSAMRNDQTRWVLMRVPNESFAQQAEMSLDETMAFFFSATLKDWQQEIDRYRQIKSLFDNVDVIRVKSAGTDISFSVKGRTFVIGDGTLNMPDGEIYTSPVETSVNGQIVFNFPGVYAGKRINGIALEFKDGQLINYSSEGNFELFEQLIQMDEGSSTIGEFGIGTNFGISRFCADILFDEKIGGTVHFALGRGYKQCGGVNQSALHWDLITDLRQQGEILADGKSVFKNGKFLELGKV